MISRFFHFQPRTAVENGDLSLGCVGPVERALKNLHSWDVTPAQARAIQEQLRGRLIRRDDFARIQTIAGIDIGFEDQGAITRAAVVLLRFPGLETLDQAVARRPTHFPYVPGFLSFREIPAALEALDKLRVKPDLLLCDGQGYAHPRRFGLACHLGLLTDLPSVGVAKSRLIGEHGSLDPRKGARAELRHAGEVIGSLLRTRADPAFGHLHRIVGKDGLLVHTALAQAHATPVFEIDGRDQ